jgi:hypothetical protein
MRSFDFVWIRSDRRVIAAADMEDEYIVGYYSQQVEALVTCHGIFPPPSIRVRSNLRTDNEANEIYGRTDHRHSV